MSPGGYKHKLLCYLATGLWCLHTASKGNSSHPLKVLSVSMLGLESEARHSTLQWYYMCSCGRRLPKALLRHPKEYCPSRTDNILLESA